MTRSGIKVEHQGYVRCKECPPWTAMSRLKRAREKRKEMLHNRSLGMSEAANEAST